MEVRRLLGVEERDHHVTLGRPRHQAPRGLERDRHRRGVVVRAGEIARRIVVGADQHRRRRAIATRRDGDEVGEGHRACQVRQRIPFAGVRVHAELGQPPEEVRGGRIVPGRSDPSALWARQPLDVGAEAARHTIVLNRRRHALSHDRA